MATIMVDVRIRGRWVLALALLLSRIAWLLPCRTQHALVQWLWQRVRYEYRVAGRSWQRLPQPPLQLEEPA